MIPWDSLAFASLEPVGPPGEPAPAIQEPALPDLQEILGADSYEPQPASVKPGCSLTCKVPQDCRYYPEQTCINGCCVF